ncbi:AraC family transcriptional regulator [Pleomorphomonas sp. JP5]|uniref:helix-turn-helix transcriptional regulator n=1 Tax=Pleomorphomonas sp. JP5 TaxID=2942998 RepID=UPI0020449E41|nr:helix-turn-helix domain-containing protein [Pleomorphomonas sp. JP5]MCM5557528.1 AraC family transcriptional regulator [Pleomorphomonas sp. JP5]
MRTPDCAILIADCAFHEDRHYEVSDDGLVRFHFNFDVSIDSRADDTAVAEIVNHSAGILMMQPDRMMVDHIPRERRQSFVTIACDPRWLSDFFNFRLEDHVERRDQDSAPFLYQELAFTQPIRSLVNTIATQPISGLGGARIATLAQKTLLLSLESLADDHRQRPARLSPNDIAAIEQARDILLGNLAAPPNIQALSRQVGINRTKLQYGFRDLYGMSVMQFAEKQRMERARVLLRDTDMSVSAIALELGYEHASSFSTRFRHHFGRPPRLIRVRS